MEPRRTKRLRPAVPPLTPTIPATTITLYADRSREQLINLILSLKNTLEAERQRRGRVEAMLCKHIDAVEAHLSEAQNLYIGAIAPKPQRSEQ
jgi:hypothetical protein